jgi:DNA mismatch repair protein MSH6
MAIAGAVLHHVATHTLPLGFFAVSSLHRGIVQADSQTHYGSLTDDFAYHPNIRRMHMQTHVDDEKMAVSSPLHVEGKADE